MKRRLPGDGPRRLGQRRTVQQAAICPTCHRAGFHAKDCPDYSPSFPTTELNPQ